MSACQVAYPAPKPKRLGYCRVPASFIQKWMEILLPAQRKVLGLVICETIGTGEKWAEISDRQFADATNVTAEVYREAVSYLDKINLIKIGKSARGRTEYSLTPTMASEADLSASTRNIQSKCSKCQTIQRAERRYVRVPHDFLRTLGACLDNASYLCLALIVFHTLDYSIEGDGSGFSSHFYELSLDDFERVFDLDKRSITGALALLCDPDGWGLVERVERKGKPALYRAIPERFGKIQRREARMVVMPERRERSANTTKKCQTKTGGQSKKGIEIESEPKPFGFCKICDDWVDLEPYIEPPVEKPPPRAAPGRETRLYKQEILAPGAPWKNEWAKN